MIFLFLSFLLYRNKIWPRKLPVYSHLCLIGHNWVMWPALAASESSRANIWFSRNSGHRQQGSRYSQSTIAISQSTIVIQGRKERQKRVRGGWREDKKGKRKLSTIIINYNIQKSRVFIYSSFHDVPLAC